MNLTTMKNTDLAKASTSKLWQLVALAIAELAQRKDDSSNSPRVAIRRINGGQPEATITVALENERRGVPPLLIVGNATLNKTNQHSFEAIEVSAQLVRSINRRAYRENSRLAV
jgi:hypothetical protein